MDRRKVPKGDPQPMRDGRMSRRERVRKADGKKSGKTSLKTSIKLTVDSDTSLPLAAHKKSDASAATELRRLSTTQGFWSEHHSRGTFSFNRSNLSRRILHKTLKGKKIVKNTVNKLLAPSNNESSSTKQGAKKQVKKSNGTSSKSLKFSPKFEKKSNALAELKRLQTTEGFWSPSFACLSASTSESVQPTNKESCSKTPPSSTKLPKRFKTTKKILSSGTASLSSIPNSPRNDSPSSSASSLDRVTRRSAGKVDVLEKGDVSMSNEDAKVTQPASVDNSNSSRSSRAALPKAKTKAKSLSPQSKLTSKKTTPKILRKKKGLELTKTPDLPVKSSLLSRTTKKEGAGRSLSPKVPGQTLENERPQTRHRKGTDLVNIKEKTRENIVKVECPAKKKATDSAKKFRNKKADNRIALDKNISSGSERKATATCSEMEVALPLAVGVKSGKKLPKSPDAIQSSKKGRPPKWFLSSSLDLLSRKRMRARNQIDSPGSPPCAKRSRSNAKTALKSSQSESCIQSVSGYEENALSSPLSVSGSRNESKYRLDSSQLLKNRDRDTNPKSSTQKSKDAVHKDNLVATVNRASGKSEFKTTNLLVSNELKRLETTDGFWSPPPPIKNIFDSSPHKLRHGRKLLSPPKSPTRHKSVLFQHCKKKLKSLKKAAVKTQVLSGLQKESDLVDSPTLTPNDLVAFRKKLVLRRKGAKEKAKRESVKFHSVAQKSHADGGEKPKLDKKSKIKSKVTMKGIASKGSIKKKLILDSVNINKRIKTSNEIGKKGSLETNVGANIFDIMNKSSKFDLTVSPKKTNEKSQTELDEALKPVMKDLQAMKYIKDEFMSCDVKQDESVSLSESQTSVQDERFVSVDVRKDDEMKDVEKIGGLEPIKSDIESKETDSKIFEENDSSGIDENDGVIDTLLRITVNDEDNHTVTELIETHQKDIVSNGASCELKEGNVEKIVSENDGKKCVEANLDIGMCQIPCNENEISDGKKYAAGGCDNNGLHLNDKDVQTQNEKSENASATTADDSLSTPDNNVGSESHNSQEHNDIPMSIVESVPDDKAKHCVIKDSSDIAELSTGEAAMVAEAVEDIEPVSMLMTSTTQDISGGGLESSDTCSQDEILNCETVLEDVPQATVLGDYLSESEEVALEKDSHSTLEEESEQLKSALTQSDEIKESNSNEVGSSQFSPDDGKDQNDGSIDDGKDQNDGSIADKAVELVCTPVVSEGNIPNANDKNLTISVSTEMQENDLLCDGETELISQSSDCEYKTLGIGNAQEENSDAGINEVSEKDVLETLSIATSQVQGNSDVISDDIKTEDNMAMMTAGHCKNLRRTPGSPKSPKDILMKVRKRRRKMNRWKRGVVVKYDNSKYNKRRRLKAALEASNATQTNDSGGAEKSKEALSCQRGDGHMSMRGKTKSGKRMLKRLTTEANFGSAPILEESKLLTRTKRGVLPLKKIVSTVTPTLDPNIAGSRGRGRGRGKDVRQSNEPRVGTAVEDLSISIPENSPQVPSSLSLPVLKPLDFTAPADNSLDGPPPVLTPQFPLSFEVSATNENVEDDIVEEFVDESNLHLYWSDEEKSPVKKGSPVKENLLSLQDQPSTSAIVPKPPKKLKGKKGRPPGIKATKKSPKTARKTMPPQKTMYQPKITELVRTFEFRKKTTRSPLEMLEMKRRQEEAMYDMQEQQRQARLTLLREKRFAKFIPEAAISESLSSDEDDDLLMKPCSVVLHDFVKKLRLDGMFVPGYEDTEVNSSPYSLDYEDENDEDWYADLEDIEEDDEDIGEFGDAPKRPQIPRLKLKRVIRNQNVPELKSRNLVSQLKSPEQDPLKLVIKTEPAEEPQDIVPKQVASSATLAVAKELLENASSRTTQNPSSIDLAEVERAGFVGSYLDFLKERPPDGAVANKQIRFKMPTPPKLTTPIALYSATSKPSTPVISKANAAAGTRNDLQKLLAATKVSPLSNIRIVDVKTISGEEIIVPDAEKESHTLNVGPINNQSMSVSEKHKISVLSLPKETNIKTVGMSTFVTKDPADAHSFNVRKCTELSHNQKFPIDKITIDPIESSSMVLTGRHCSINEESSQQRTSGGNDVTSLQDESMPVVPPAETDAANTLMSAKSGPENETSPTPPNVPVELSSTAQTPQQVMLPVQTCTDIGTTSKTPDAPVDTVMSDKAEREQNPPKVKESSEALEQNAFTEVCARSEAITMECAIRDERDSDVRSENAGCDKPLSEGFSTSLCKEIEMTSEAPTTRSETVSNSNESDTLIDKAQYGGQEANELSVSQLDKVSVCIENETTDMASDMQIETDPGVGSKSETALNASESSKAVGAKTQNDRLSASSDSEVTKASTPPVNAIAVYVETQNENQNTSALSPTSRTGQTKEDDNQSSSSIKSHSNNNNEVKPVPLQKDLNNSPVHSTSDNSNAEAGQSSRLKIIVPQDRQPSTYQYTCKKCSFTTSTKLIIESHVYSHIPGVQFQCATCTTEFSSMTAAASHLKNTHVLSNHKLNITGYVDEANFYDKTDNPAALVEQDNSPSSCVSSQVTPGATGGKSSPFIIVVSSGAGNRGVRSGSSNHRRYVCSHCGFSTNVRADIEQHVSDLHLSQGLYDCTLCDKSVFSSEDDIRQHCASVHPSRPKPYRKLPDFYDAEHLAKMIQQKGDQEEHGSPSTTNIYRVSSVLGVGDADSTSVVDHQLKAKEYLYLQEDWKGKKSAEADSTTGADYSEDTPIDNSKEDELTVSTHDVIEDASIESSHVSPVKASSSEKDFQEDVEPLPSNLEETMDVCASDLSSLPHGPCEMEAESGGGSLGVKIMDVVSLSEGQHYMIPNEALNSMASSSTDGTAKESALSEIQTDDQMSDNSSLSTTATLHSVMAVSQQEEQPKATEHQSEAVTPLLPVTVENSATSTVETSTSPDVETSNSPAVDISTSSVVENSRPSSLSCVQSTSKSPQMEKSSSLSQPSSLVVRQTDSSDTSHSVDELSEQQQASAPSLATPSPATSEAQKTPPTQQSSDTSGTSSENSSAAADPVSTPSSSATSSSSPPLAGGFPLSYKCKACKVHTPYLLMMVKHLKSRHSNIRCFSCPYCKSSSSFVSQKQLRHHVRSQHPSMVGKNEISLSREANKLVEPMVLPYSSQCTRVGSRLVLEEDIHTCTLCSLRMTSMPNVYDHLKEKHSDLFEFICPVCQAYKSKSLQDISNHCISQHDSNLDKDKFHVSVPKYLFAVLKCISAHGKYIEKALAPPETTPSTSKSPSVSSSATSKPATPAPSSLLSEAGPSATVPTKGNMKSIAPQSSTTTNVVPSNLLPSQHQSQPISLALAMPTPTGTIISPIVALPVNHPVGTSTQIPINISSALFDTSSLVPVTIASKLTSTSSATGGNSNPMHSPSTALIAKSTTRPSTSKSPKNVATLPVLNVPSIKARSDSLSPYQQYLQKQQGFVASLGTSSSISPSSHPSTADPDVELIPENEPNPDAFKIFNLRPSSASLTMTPNIPQSATGAPSSQISGNPSVFPPVSSSSLALGFLPGPIAGFPAAMVIPPNLVHNAFPFAAAAAAANVRPMNASAMGNVGSGSGGGKSSTPSSVSNMNTRVYIPHGSNRNPQQQALSSYNNSLQAIPTPVSSMLQKNTVRARQHVEQQQQQQHQQMAHQQLLRNMSPSSIAANFMNPHTLQRGAAKPQAPPNVSMEHLQYASSTNLNPWRLQLRSPFPQASATTAATVSVLSGQRSLPTAIGQGQTSMSKKGKRGSQMYQCPYCPHSIELRALDVASHIHQVHPGSPVTFQKITG